MYHCEGLYLWYAGGSYWLSGLPGFFVLFLFLVFWWRKTQVLEGVVGSNLQSWGENRSGKERAKREMVQTPEGGCTGVKSHWVG
jgi:hypothetical protein